MDLLEIILPILFAVGYFIVAAMKGGNKEENASPAREQETESDLSERERNIQEEIRRKIMERTRGGEGGAESASFPAEGEADTSYDPTRPESDQGRRQIREQVRRVEDPPPVPAESSRTPGNRRSSWDRLEEQEPPPLQPAMQRREDDIQERMRKQQEEIDAMQRRAEEIRKKASQQSGNISSQAIGQSAIGGRRQNYRRGTGSFQAEVIDALKDPRGFKKAILSYEILGTPIGLRKQEKIGPLWQQ